MLRCFEHQGALWAQRGREMGFAALVWEAGSVWEHVNWTAVEGRERDITTKWVYRSAQNGHVFGGQGI